MGARLANNLWQAACLPGWRKFQRATGQVEETQRRLLLSYLRANADTDYGRRFKFASIASIEAYQKSVPLTTYDDYAEAIEAIARGRQGVLTRSPVRMFELSSGSTAASKLIPYTAQLRAEFQTGITAWVYGLFRETPDLKNGTAYWSISPLTDGPHRTPAGIPIGFEADSAYLGALGRYLAGTALAVPNEIKHLRDAAAFRYATLLFLLRRRELRIISVWSPTFLELLLAALPGWWQALIDDLAEGALTPPNGMDSQLKKILLEKLPADPTRASELTGMQASDYGAIWPRLGLISCWMDGPSARLVHRLRDRFPGAQFQGKGLIATEAFVSLPVAGLAGAVLAVNAHFFEFLPVDPETHEPMSDRPQLAHRLDRGQAYAVVVTTGGGFYRYQLQDIVEVVDHLDEAPCLRFLGKTDQVSDWFGEKLNEGFVAQVLADIFEQRGLCPAFSLLAPDDAGEGFRYALYVELPPEQQTSEVLGNLRADLDRSLRRNFHYDYCRRLGQLAEPGIYAIASGGMDSYLTARMLRGQRLGNIKPPALEKTTGWQDHFIVSPRQP